MKGFENYGYTEKELRDQIIEEIRNQDTVNIDDLLETYHDIEFTPEEIDEFDEMIYEVEMLVERIKEEAEWELEKAIAEAEAEQIWWNRFYEHEVA